MHCLSADGQAVARNTNFARSLHRAPATIRPVSTTNSMENASSGLRRALKDHAPPGTAHAPMRPKSVTAHLQMRCCCTRSAQKVHSTTHKSHPFSHSATVRNASIARRQRPQHPPQVSPDACPGPYFCIRTMHCRASGDAQMPRFCILRRGTFPGNACKTHASCPMDDGARTTKGRPESTDPTLKSQAAPLS